MGVVTERTRQAVFYSNEGPRTISVAVHVMSKNLSGGNRLDIKEYPNSNENLIQHLGNSTEQISLSYKVTTKGEDYQNTLKDFLNICRRGKVVRYHDAFYGNIRDVFIVNWSINEGNNMFQGSVTLAIPSSSDYLRERARFKGFSFIDSVLDVANTIRTASDDLFIGAIEIINDLNPANAINEVFTASLEAYTSFLGVGDTVVNDINSILKLPFTIEDGIRSAVDKGSALLLKATSIGRNVKSVSEVSREIRKFLNDGDDSIDLSEPIPPEQLEVDKYVATQHVMNYLSSSTEGNSPETLQQKTEMINELILKYEGSVLQSDLEKDILTGFYSIRNVLLDSSGDIVNNEIRVEQDGRYNIITFFYENNLNFNNMSSFIEKNKVDIYNMKAGTYIV